MAIISLHPYNKSKDEYSCLHVFILTGGVFMSLSSIFLMLSMIAFFFFILFILESYSEDGMEGIFQKKYTLIDLGIFAFASIILYFILL